MEEQDLQRSYENLKKDIITLAQEYKGLRLADDISTLEVSYIEEKTADELSAAGAGVAVLALFHTVSKILLPSKAYVPIIGGAWLLGGAFIIIRVTASTAVGWASMTERNARRKMALQKKVDQLQRRIDSLLADVGGDSGGEEEGEKEQERNVLTPPPDQQQQQQHDSPPLSIGSSIELVEAPLSPEIETGTDTTTTAAPEKEKEEKEEGGAMQPSASPHRGRLDSWRQYASLGGSGSRSTPHPPTSSSVDEK